MGAGVLGRDGTRAGKNQRLAAYASDRSSGSEDGRVRIERPVINLSSDDTDYRWRDVRRRSRRGIEGVVGRARATGCDTGNRYDLAGSDVLVGKGGGCIGEGDGVAAQNPSAGQGHRIGDVGVVDLVHAGTRHRDCQRSDVSGCSGARVDAVVASVRATLRDSGYRDEFSAANVFGVKRSQRVAIGYVVACQLTTGKRHRSSGIAVIDLAGCCRAHCNRELRDEHRVRTANQRVVTGKAATRAVVQCQGAEGGERLGTDILASQGTEAGYNERLAGDASHGSRSSEDGAVRVEQ